MRAFLFAVSTLILLLSSMHAEGPGEDFIVKLNPGQSIFEMKRSYPMTVKGQIPGSRIYLVDPVTDAEGFLKNLSQDRRVAHAEFNQTIRLNSAETLMEAPALSQEMAAMLDDSQVVAFNGAIVPAAYAEQAAVQRIALDGVRGLNTGAGTRVAYIDTGVDPLHPALAPWVDPGADLLSGGSASEFEGLSQEMAAMLDYEMAALLDKRFMLLLGATSSPSLSSLPATPLPAAFGHGTLVAGLIHLVAPDARLVPLRAFDAYGYTTLFTLVASVHKAIDLNVDVLNLSFSMEHDAPILREALRAARAAKIVVVASAGNENRTTDEVYPASYSETIGVAATDLNDRRAEFSNYGKGVAISAPGAFVVSTVPGGRYAAVWGTSFSAPIVSGAISLIASGRGFGQLDPLKIVNSADSIDVLNPGFERMLGKGRLNVTKAFNSYN